MNKILIALLLIVNLATIKSQDFANLIKTDGSKTLYLHTENKFELDESKLGVEEIQVETDKGEIKRFSKGKYMIKPNAPGECTILIYNKDKSGKIYTQKFWVIASVKPEIMPVFGSQEFKISDNEIPRARLEDLKGFSPMVFSQNQVIFLVDDMQLIIYSKENGNSEFQTNGKLSAEIKEKIKLLHEGDLILLKNIKVKSVTDYAKKDNPDQIINILPTVFFVK